MRYGLSMMMILLVGCAATATQSGCALLTPDRVTGQAPIQSVVISVAPFIPGPWGALAAAAATAAVGAGSFFAKRKVNAEFAAKGTDVGLSALTKGLAERKYLLPLLASVPFIGKAFGLWDMNTEAAITAAITALVGVGADVVEKKVTSPTPPTT